MVGGGHQAGGRDCELLGQGGGRHCVVLLGLGAQAGGAAGGGGHGTVLATAGAPAPPTPLTGGGLVADRACPGLAGAGTGGGPTATVQTRVKVILWTVDLSSQLQDHVQGLPPLVAHQADRALVHHLVQDHKVVVLQHGVRH